MTSSQYSLLAAMILLPGLIGGAVIINKVYRGGDGWKNYSGETFELRYPKQVELTEEKRPAGLIVTLDHSIDYPHADPCDFKGTGAQLETLTDFHVTLSVVDRSIEQAAGQDLSSLTPVSIGTLSGYQIEHSVESCGFVSSYFDLGGGKTLAVERSLVAELSTITGTAADLLKNPDVVSPQEADAWWNTILATFRAK